MRRILLVVTVALVMVAMVLVTAMPVFAQPDKRQGPPSAPPGYNERVQKEYPAEAKAPQTGPQKKA